MWTLPAPLTTSKNAMRDVFLSVLADLKGNQEQLAVRTGRASAGTASTGAEPSSSNSSIKDRTTFGGRTDTSCGVRVLGRMSLLWVRGAATQEPTKW